MGKLLELIFHPSELISVIQLERQNLRDVSTESPQLQRCYYLLKKTSRSFAAVIEELHPELRNTIMIFYLVLRAMDTIEDDMTIDSKVKLSLLRTFDEKLTLQSWNFHGNADTEKDKCVLVEFDLILQQYQMIKSNYKDVIKDITKKMGNGMADYIENKSFNSNGLVTIEDYDLYCHYVAGLVGEGLTRLIVLAGFGNTILIKNITLYESMGLFLQKTNIIRDYSEDQRAGRAFWPKDIWSKYAENLGDFLNLKNQQQGLYCISEMICNALDHVVDVLHYLSLVTEQTSFNFCAIPQVMAIATLELLFQNKKVFFTNLKIRKGTTISLILESRTLRGVCDIFRLYIRRIHNKSHPSDPNYLRLGATIGKIEQFVEIMYPENVPKDIKICSTEITEIIARRNLIDYKMASNHKEEQYKANFVFIGFLFCLFSVLYSMLHML